MIVYLGLYVAIAGCALMAVWAARLLTAILWLAATSILVAIVLYGLGAREVAVIELSVGAGLVTVLLVVAISIAGEDASQLHSLIPRWLTVALISGALFLLGWLILPNPLPAVTDADTPFAVTLWQTRGVDMLLQIALVFTGLLTVLGLLADARKPNAAADIQAVTGEGSEKEAAEEEPEELPV